MITSGDARAAFDLSREPQATREKYGLHRWGQMGLLARRLVEAGVRQTLGLTYRALGDYEAASKHLLRALELREHAGDDHVFHCAIDVDLIEATSSAEAPP